MEDDACPRLPLPGLRLLLPFVELADDDFRDFTNLKTFFILAILILNDILQFYVFKVYDIFAWSSKITTVLLSSYDMQYIEIYTKGMQVCNEYDVWLFLLLLSLVASSYAKLISVMRRRHKETNVDMYCTCFVERTYPLKEYEIIRKRERYLREINMLSSNTNIF